MKKSILLLALLWSSLSLMGQSELLEELENTSTQEVFQSPAFKAMKIGNLQSTKVAKKGDLYMYVSHRFGSLEDGVDTFFGLDNANTKIQMVYGLFNGVQIGMSRESLRKTYAGSLKVGIMSQSNKFPLHMVLYTTANCNTQLRKEQYPKLKLGDRMSYATQLLVSRRITKQLSLLVAPTFVRQNLVLEPNQVHNQYALGAGGRIKLTKRMSVNLDYVYHFNRAKESSFKNPLTVGIDIETGGHVFQLLFSNAQSTNEPGFISNAEGDWAVGAIFFGFNIVRVF